MTEAKNYKEPELPEDLKDYDAASDFLTSPYRETLMMPFVLGSNKLKLYGIPLNMAKRSKLIESMLPKLAASKGPHELYSFTEVSERVALLVWAALEDHWHPLAELDHTIDEYLEIHRLVSYLDMDSDYVQHYSAACTFFGLKDDEMKKIVEEKKNQDVLARIFDACFKEGTCSRWMINVENVGYFLDEGIFLKLNTLCPELLKKMNYIPIYIGKYYKAYVDRKVVDKPELFLQKNEDLWAKEDNKYMYTRGLPEGAVMIVRLTVESWGSDMIKFNIYSTNMIGNDFDSVSEDISVSHVIDG